MSYFNLKRLAKLLTFLLAFLPISDVVAASAATISNTDASSIILGFDSSDISEILTDAGLTAANASANLVSTLTYTYNASKSKYKLPSNLNSFSVIQSLFNTYNTQTQSIMSAINQSQSVTLAAVNAVMQNLVTLMAAVFRASGKSLLDGASALILPFTGQPILTNKSADLDAYIVNNFVQELASWLPYYQNVVSGNIANTNNIMLQKAADQLGLVPATAQQMQQLINNSTNLTSLYGATGTSCNANLTIQKQINCAIAWYTNQLNILTTNTANITAATTALGVQVGSNGPVDNAKEAISGLTGAVATYGPQITSATTTSAVVQAYNSGVSAINAAYSSLIGNTGVIATQNNAFTAAKTAADAAVTALTSASPSANFTTAQAAYNAAVTAFTTDYNTATTDFPATLPSTLDYPTANSTPALQNSVPGAAVINLYTDQNTNSQSPAQVITNVSSKVTALNNAVTALITVFSNDQATGITNINNATTVADANTAFNNALAQINQDYMNQVLAGTYSNALTSAITLETTLNNMKSMNPVPTGLTGALAVQTNAVNAAKAQFPEAPNGSAAITFSVSNSTGSGPYASSVIGLAITALNNALTKQLASLQNPASNAQTTVATNLNSALTTAKTAITNAQAVGLTAIGAATSATVASVLTTQVANINTAYLTVMAAGGAYLTAYNAANNMASNATAGVISALSSAITAANTALPIIANPGTAPFTIANSTGTGQYAASIPGQAITALQNAADLFDPTALATNLGSAVSGLTNAINTDQTSGITSINAAGVSGAQQQLNNAVGLINADYLDALTDNNVAALLEAAGKITSPSAALTAAVASTNNAYPIVTNPGTAPFTIANSTGTGQYAASIPGKAITALQNAAGLFDPNALATNLGSAVTNLTNTINTDQTNGITSINAASGSTAQQAALTAAIQQITKDYLNALTNNNVAALLSYAANIPSPSAALTAAITAANNAYPIVTNPGTAPFTIANSTGTGQYAASIPGKAITALNNAASGSGGSSGSSAGKLAGIIIGAIAGFLGIAALASYLAYQKSPQFKEFVDDLVSSGKDLLGISQAQTAADMDAAAEASGIEMTSNVGSMVDAAEGFPDGTTGSVKVSNAVKIKTACDLLKANQYSADDVVNILKVARGGNLTDDQLVDNLTTISENPGKLIQPGDSLAKIQNSFDIIDQAQTLGINTDNNISKFADLVQEYQTKMNAAGGAASATSVEDAVARIESDFAASSLNGKLSLAQAIDKISDPAFPAQDTVEDTLTTLGQTYADNPALTASSTAADVDAAAATEVTTDEAYETPLAAAGVDAAHMPAAVEMAKSIANGKTKTFGSETTTPQEAVSNLLEVIKPAGAIGTPLDINTAIDLAITPNALPAPGTAVGADGLGVPTNPVDAAQMQMDVIFGANELSIPANPLQAGDFLANVQQGTTSLATDNKISFNTADGNPLVIGGQGQNVNGADLFNSLAKAGKAFDAANVSDLIGNMSAADYQAQVQALADQLDKIDPNSPEYQELKAQLDAANQAGQDKYNGGGGEDFKPVEPAI